MVAVVQMVIALGAAGGGIVYDARGYSSTFTMSAVALLASALLWAKGLARQSGRC
jgi:predicted MFS family arabinose efflux permease